MGGRRGRCLLLGLLLLISGSAEEETSGPPADIPVAPTIPLPLNSSEFPDLSVSGSADSTPEAPGNDVTEQTPPPATPTDDTESNSTTASVTIDETSPDPGRTNSNDTTGADATLPPPTAPPTPVTPPPPTTLPPSTAHNMTADSASETPSILATLRATDETPLHDDSSPLTTTSTSIYSPGMSPITTTVTVPASSATTEISSTAAAPHTTRAEGQRGAAVLEVGDEKDLTGYHSRNGSNPLFVMIVSVFTIMVVMVVVVVGFHRYKKKNSRTEFRRLQDLPMDDMMEDTPLSLYSY